MKKWNIVTLAAAAVIALTPVSSHAAVLTVSGSPAAGSGQRISLSASDIRDSLQSKLDSAGIRSKVFVFDGCNINPGKPEVPPTPELPEDPQTPAPPITPEQPGAPDSPGTEKPELKPENNSYARQVVTLVNAERAREGLAPLSPDASVEKAANVRAREIVSSFSHTRPNGASFTSALTESGVSFRGAGENIAWGQISPEEVVAGWMNSPGHRANIMNQNFTAIGVGHYQNSNGVQYWTQLFTY